MPNINTLSDKAFKQKFPGAEYTGAREATVKIDNQTFFWEQNLEDHSWWNIEIRTTYSATK